MTSYRDAIPVPRHWFRLMSDTHERFCWTTQPCRVMLLHRGMSLSLGGDDDFDPYAMSLLSWDEHRGPAHLHHSMWRTPDPVPLCPLCPVFFRNTSYPYRPVENTHCPRGASPCSPHRRGRDQCGDTALWREQKQYLSLARAPQWFKKTLLLFALAHQSLQRIIEGDELYTRV